MRWTVLAASILLACGTSTTPAPSTTATAPEPSAAPLTGCAARVALFESRVAAVSPGAWSFGVPAGLETTSGTMGDARAPMGPVLELARDGSVTIDGRAHDELAQVGEDLATIRRNWSMLHPGSAAPDEIALWADRHAHVSQLRPLLALASGIRWSLLVSDASEAPAVLPCPPSLGASCAQIASGDPEHRATAISEAMGRATGSCRAIIRLFGSIASTDAATRASTFRAGAPHAVAECDCEAGIDVDAFEYLTVVTLGALDPRVRVVPLPAPSESDDALEVGAWLDRSLAPPSR